MKTYKVYLANGKEITITTPDSPSIVIEPFGPILRFGYENNYILKMDAVIAVVVIDE